MNHPPTPEQSRALELFATGESMVIEAGAGTGKTSTLELLARSTSDRGQYVAFNKSIVVEAGSRMPDTVASSTAHSLAYRAVGKDYSRRLRGSARMKSTEVARALDVSGLTCGGKQLAAGYLAGHVMRAVGAYCQSADEVVGVGHFPFIEGIDEVDPKSGRRRDENNRWLRRQLLPAAQRAWRDIVRPDGVLPFRHDHYLKAWALGHPRLPVDYVLLDEAQDTNPVLAGVFAEQDHAQRVAVGDTAQQIYAWRGAINALANIDAEHRAFLTQSFRFGPAIAEAANAALELLGSEMRLLGTPSIPSRIGPVAEPGAVLTRTNAKAVETTIASLAAGRTVHIVGGAEEVLSFAKAADRLQRGERVTHPELACFEDWAEVVLYVAEDPQGGELRMLVDLIEKYGVETILRALGNMAPEKDADVVISTAHKAKGREWSTVRLASDFAELEESDEAELRLAYVAITRAKLVLDDGGLLAHLDRSPTPPAVPAGRG